MTMTHATSSLLLPTHTHLNHSCLVFLATKHILEHLTMSPAVDNGYSSQVTSHKVVKPHNGNGVHGSDSQVTSATLINMEHEYGAHK
jgi:hypothetical protein